MLNLDQLREKASKMSNYLELKAGNDPEKIIERLELLSIMLIQSGECLADAKYHQDQVIHSTITKALTESYHDRLSATLIKDFVRATAKDFNYLVTIFDRINSACVHQIDSLRSVLSYIKAQKSIL